MNNILVKDDFKTDGGTSFYFYFDAKSYIHQSEQLEYMFIQTSFKNSFELKKINTFEEVEEKCWVHYLRLEMDEDYRNKYW